MTPRHPTDFVLIHADESCLGNGRPGDNPGGAGSLVEVRTPDGLARRDIYISSPATTNNRMALAGAIATFALLSRRGNRFRITYVSDSEYLIKGITQWVPGWVARGWRRKAGPVENLELWQRLTEAVAGHGVRWQWVRGHAGHVKNEYVNHLAIMAASEQVHSEGAIPSHFEEWLGAQQARGRFVDDDPDAEFDEHEERHGNGS